MTDIASFTREGIDGLGQLAELLDPDRIGRLLKAAFGPPGQFLLQIIEELRRSREDNEDSREQAIDERLRKFLDPEAFIPPINAPQ